MSEHIESKIYKFSKGSLANHQNRNDRAEDLATLDEAEMSNFAGRSENTKLSRVADVSPPVPLMDNQRHVISFNKSFERLYFTFADKVMNEFNQMRNSYIIQMQENFEKNY